MAIIRRISAALDAVAYREADPQGGADKLSLAGHAALYRQPALIGSRDWGFVEWIERGAFTPALDDDVRLLFNHDGLPLARTTNSTLALSEDKQGLAFQADLAPVQMSRDLVTLVERGDVSQMSFAFIPGQLKSGRISRDDPEAAGHKGIAIDDSWDGMPYQAVTTVRQLFDVSAVTYPAYEGTDVVVKSDSDTEAEIERVMREVEAARATVAIDISLSTRRASRIGYWVAHTISRGGTR